MRYECKKIAEFNVDPLEKVQIIYAKKNVLRKSDRKLLFLTFNTVCKSLTFWVIFCTFSTDSKKFGVYDTHIKFKKKHNCAYVSTFC